MSLPTGISRAQISEFLANLNFGGPAGEAEATASIEGGEDASGAVSGNAVSASGTAGVADDLLKSYAPALFRKPGTTTQKLRQLAREGREEMLAREEREKGKPKIVLGQPFPPPGYELAQGGGLRKVGDRSTSA